MNEIGMNSYDLFQKVRISLLFQSCGLHYAYTCLAANTAISSICEKHFYVTVEEAKLFPRSSFTKDEQSIFARSFHRASLPTASHSSLIIFIVTTERFSHFVFILPSSYQSSSLVMEDMIYS